MQIVTREQRLLNRAYWLVTHRWFAIIALGLITWLTGNITDIGIHQKPLYILSAALIVENLFSLWLLELISNRTKKKLFTSVRWVIHIQIIFDLIILTVILHFTGGITNPFFFIYIFHMVIASILLSRTEAFLLTSFALLLLGALIFLEYKSIIPYYCLCTDEIPNHQLYKDPYYISKTFGVFAFSSYILVYLATSIGHRLRDQEDRLTEAIKQLKINDEIKNHYVLRITNEINSHLVAIQQSLTDFNNHVLGELQPKQQAFLDKTSHQTFELTKFSKNLLHLMRLRLGDEMDKQILSLGDMIVEAINNYYELAEEKDLSFELRLDESIDKYYGNKISFESIFDNLIGNAIKYSNHAGVVSVESKDKRRKIQIEISDNGIGIPIDEQKHIFNEFFRARNVKNTGIKGSGVGLSIVKESVESHNGKISFESKPGNGSRFIIELPKL